MCAIISERAAASHFCACAVVRRIDLNSIQYTFTTPIVCACTCLCENTSDKESVYAPPWESPLPASFFVGPQTNHAPASLNVAEVLICQFVLLHDKACNEGIDHGCSLSRRTFRREKIEQMSIIEGFQYGRLFSDAASRLSSHPSFDELLTRLKTVNRASSLLSGSFQCSLERAQLTNPDLTLSVSDHLHLTGPIVGQRRARCKLAGAC